MEALGADPTVIGPTSSGDWYRPGDGLGALVITFVSSTGGPVSDLADVFLKHLTLSDERVIRRWPTDQPLVVRDLISTNTGIYELQVLPDHHQAVGRFVTINDGQTTQVQLTLKDSAAHSLQPSGLIATKRPTAGAEAEAKPLPPARPESHLVWSGKIAGLLFDQFGDFSGFLLKTANDENMFFSCEKGVQALAERVWRDRLRITVEAERDEPLRPKSIIVREPPAMCGH